MEILRERVADYTGGSLERRQNTGVLRAKQSARKIEQRMGTRTRKSRSDRKRTLGEFHRLTKSAHHSWRRLTLYS